MGVREGPRRLLEAPRGPRGRGLKDGVLRHGRARPKRCFGEFVGRFRFDFVLQQWRNEDRTKENKNKTKAKNIV